MTKVRFPLPDGSTITAALDPDRVSVNGVELDMGAEAALDRLTGEQGWPQRVLAALHLVADTGSEADGWDDPEKWTAVARLAAGDRTTDGMYGKAWGHQSVALLVVHADEKQARLAWFCGPLPAFEPVLSRKVPRPPSSGKTLVLRDIGEVATRSLGFFPASQDELDFDSWLTSRGGVTA